MRLARGVGVFRHGRLRDDVGAEQLVQRGQRLVEVAVARVLFDVLAHLVGRAVRHALRRGAQDAVVVKVEQHLRRRAARLVFRGVEARAERLRFVKQRLLADCRRLRDRLALNLRPRRADLGIAVHRENHVQAEERHPRVRDVVALTHAVGSEGRVVERRQERGDLRLGVRAAVGRDRPPHERFPLRAARRAVYICARFALLVGAVGCRGLVGRFLPRERDGLVSQLLEHVGVHELPNRDARRARLRRVGDDGLRPDRRRAGEEHRRLHEHLRESRHQAGHRGAARGEPSAVAIRRALDGVHNLAQRRVRLIPERGIGKFVKRVLLHAQPLIGGYRVERAGKFRVLAQLRAVRQAAERADRVLVRQAADVIAEPAAGDDGERRPILRGLLHGGLGILRGKPFDRQRGGVLLLFLEGGLRQRLVERRVGRQGRGRACCFRRHFSSSFPFSVGHSRWP